MRERLPSRQLSLPAAINLSELNRDFIVKLFFYKRCSILYCIKLSHRAKLTGYYLLL